VHRPSSQETVDSNKTNARHPRRGDGQALYSVLSERSGTSTGRRSDAGGRDTKARECATVVFASTNQDERTRVDKDTWLDRFLDRCIRPLQNARAKTLKPDLWRLDQQKPLMSSRPPRGVGANAH
jgi:hypothetical protein